MSTDFFLDLPGITGESSDYVYKNAIDIDSIGWDLKNSGTTQVGRGGGSGKVEGGFRIAENMSTLVCKNNTPTVVQIKRIVAL